MNKIIENVLTDLRQGSLKLAYENKQYINMLAADLYNNPNLSSGDIDDLLGLITIGNITYNNTDRELLPIEDGVYDLLLEKYKPYNPNFQVGAEVIEFAPFNSTTATQPQLKEAVSFISPEDQDKIVNGMWTEELMIDPFFYFDDRDFYNPALQNPENYITKRKHDTEHNHPELVGTLDKCKFVYNLEAAEKGVLYDSNVKTVERDFFGPHLQAGIINTIDAFDMVYELKYDGISVEADCSNEVISARSRGDTGVGKASDLTPILKGYRFPHRSPGAPVVGVKFEAIITQYDLPAFNAAKGYEYKNCRSAIVALFASSDAWKYRDFITLVPLEVENSVKDSMCSVPGLGYDRIVEIEYLNKEFISKACPLRYGSYRGNVFEQLTQINRFTQEAEFLRAYIPFMYDGIVVSYRFGALRSLLGRENFINKYSIAVKFNPLKKSTIFNGYTYTVGQDGSITPMIWYDPVEFYGTIHNKSSGHSLQRFNELQLRPGDMIDVEYVNDVMPYVTKPDNEYNRRNAEVSPVVPFPETCPICGQPISISATFKSAKCINPDCGGRTISRMVNSCAKLGMNGFGEATIRQCKVTHLKDLFEIFNGDEPGYALYELGFGPIEIANMCEEAYRILTTPIYDSTILGCVGFDNISNKTFELILSKMTYESFKTGIEFKEQEFLFVDMLRSIKGIGEATIETIIQEYPYFKDDIDYMMSHCNVVPFVQTKGKKVRFTGFRDKQVVSLLKERGFDVDENGSITKDTDYLLVPLGGHTSTKTKRASELGIQIVPVQDFINDIDRYI